MVYYKGRIQTLELCTRIITRAHNERLRCLVARHNLLKGMNCDYEKARSPAVLAELRRILSIEERFMKKLKVEDSEEKQVLKKIVRLLMQSADTFDHDFELSPKAQRNATGRMVHRIIKSRKVKKYIKGVIEFLGAMDDDLERILSRMKQEEIYLNEPTFRHQHEFFKVWRKELKLNLALEKRFQKMRASTKVVKVYVEKSRYWRMVIDRSIPRNGLGGLVAALIAGLSAAFGKDVGLPDAAIDGLVYVGSAIFVAASFTMLLSSDYTSHNDILETLKEDYGLAYQIEKAT